MISRKLWVSGLVLLGSSLGLRAQEPTSIVPTRPDPSVLIWSVATDSPSFGSGAVADLDGDGRPEVVFGCYYGDELFRCLDGRTGTERWRQKSSGGPLDASVLVIDVNGDQRPEVIYGDSAHGLLWCRDADGKELWTYQGPSGTDSPPAAADLDGDGTIEIVYGTMKVKGQDGRVVCLEGKSGAERWSAAVPGHVQSEPALVDLDQDGILDVLVNNWMGDDKLRALSGRNGSELWTFATGDWIYHGVSVADLDGDDRPEVIVADRAGRVFMLEGESGRTAWTAQLEGESKGTVFGPTTLVDADGQGALEIAVCGRNLHLLDARGKLRWRKEFGPYSIARGTSTADVDGDGAQDLVFGCGTVLRALRARDGRELWAWDLASENRNGERIDNAPLLADLDGDGKLDVFVVIGAGTSGKDRPMNRGRAWALHAGKGKASETNSWRTFRGSSSRRGLRSDSTGIRAPAQRRAGGPASDSAAVAAKLPHADATRNVSPKADSTLELELALDSGIKLGGCAIGDVDPDHPGNEVVTVAEDGRIFVCRREDDGWKSEMVHQAPGELIQCAIGDADPARPGLEIVGVGMAKGGEKDGGRGAVTLVEKTAKGWQGRVIFSDEELVHGVAIGSGVVYTVGFSLAVNRLTPGPGEHYQAEFIGITRAPGKNALLDDGRLLVCCTDGRLMRFEPGEEGAVWKSLVLDQREAGRARIGVAGKQMIVADDDGSLRVLGPEKPELVHKESMKLRGAVFADLDPDSPGLELGTVGYEGKLTIFRGPPFARRAQVVYRDIDALHHLAAGDLDGLPGDELATCGYGGRVIIVRRAQ